MVKNEVTPSRQSVTVTCNQVIRELNDETNSSNLFLHLSSNAMYLLFFYQFQSSKSDHHVVEHNSYPVIEKTLTEHHVVEIAVHSNLREY